MTRSLQVWYPRSGGSCAGCVDKAGRRARQRNHCVCKQSGFVQAAIKQKTKRKKTFKASALLIDGHAWRYGSIVGLPGPTAGLRRPGNGFDSANIAGHTQHELLVPSPLNSQGLVTFTAPKPMNSQGLVTSMAPSPINSQGLVTSMAPNPINS